MEPYTADTRTKKVFIIEDNEMHSMMMDYLLSKDNSFNIFKFKSGEEGIKRLNISPDIIILDYELPGINGIDTLARIKKHNPAVPVVVVTENNSPQLKRRFLEGGAYDYIMKGPGSFHELNTVVDSILNTLSVKENKANNKTTLMLVGGFVLLVLLSCIISYVVLKH